jgi:hypothetical protein
MKVAPMSNEKLTGDERLVLNLLGEAYNAFLLLPRQHPSEADEFRLSIHRCQDIVGMRVARRSDPDLLPTYITASASG